MYTAVARPGIGTYIYVYDAQDEGSLLVDGLAAPRANGNRDDTYLRHVDR